MMKKSTGSLHLCLFCGLFVATRSETGKILPPENVTALWVSDFEPGLSWDPPHNLPANCSYRVKGGTKGRYPSDILHKPPKVIYKAMQGGSWTWTVMTKCNDSESDPVVYNINYPDLVTDLECFLYSPQNARCQWSPVKTFPETRFFYYLVDERHQNVSLFRECESYNWTHGVRTGCELEATRFHNVFILFNATLNTTLVRNTFNRHLMDDVRPPPLNFTVKKINNKFNISWKLPEIRIPDAWKTEIKYTSCGVEHSPFESEGTSHELDVPRNCQTKIAVRAKSAKGATPWGFWEDTDGAVSPDVLMYALAAVIPVLMAVMAALMCVCFHKNKDKIFPKIPVPVNHLSEFLNNNDKGHFRDLYIPTNEEENCKISLVVDPRVGYENC